MPAFVLYVITPTCLHLKIVEVSPFFADYCVADDISISLSTCTPVSTCVETPVIGVGGYRNKWSGS